MKFIKNLINLFKLCLIQTPSGVYCPARSLGKPPPKAPKAFEFRAQIVAPLPGFDDLIGEITNIRV
jgi:hypothetical protein